MPNTVFGAKSVEFTSPPNPSATPLRAGQVLDSEHVTVEVNTIFEQLNSVLSHIDPAKLNETLGAMSTAFGGRGEAFGRIADRLQLVSRPRSNRACPQLSHDLQTLPDVATAYADAAPDLMSASSRTPPGSARRWSTSSPISTGFWCRRIGLADIGNDVIGSNREPLTNLMHLLVPTTDLTNEYHEALNCSLTGMLQLRAQATRARFRVSTTWRRSRLGIERYRYPQDLPKVAATGGPQCKGQLPVAVRHFPPQGRRGRRNESVQLRQSRASC